MPYLYKRNIYHFSRILHTYHCYINPCMRIFPKIFRVTATTENITIFVAWMYLQAKRVM